MIPAPTAQEIANEIRMRFNYSAGPFLLVEGDSDVSFFRCHTTIDIENIIPSFGWKNVVDAMTILQSEKHQEVVAVIDLDYRDIVPTYALPDNVLLTDSRDIETMMFSSPAFVKVLRRSASGKKITSYQHGTEGVRKKILELGRAIGSLRLYSQLKLKNYSFDEMVIEKFIDRKSLLFMRKEFIAHLRGISAENSTMPDDILKDASAEVKKTPVLTDPYRLCCGHDLIEIMAIGLKSVWGSYNSREISDTSLEELFIFAYSTQMFRTSRLFQLMDTWFQDRGYAKIWAE